MSDEAGNGQALPPCIQWRQCGVRPRSFSFQVTGNRQKANSMSKWKPSEATEDFLKAMKSAGMVPTCPQCGDECFCPVLAQTLESRKAGTLILWCKDMGHWAGDVRAAAWKHKSLLNVA